MRWAHYNRPASIWEAEGLTETWALLLYILKRRMIMSDYVDCVYNYWEGLKGRETCMAGYLWCREEACDMYTQNPVKKNNTLKHEEDT